jgi:hypothetical protein
MFSPFSKGVNDPLADAAGKIIKENNIRRATKEAYHKELGIQNPKNLPWEKQAEYQTELETRTTKALTEGVEEKKNLTELSKKTIGSYFEKTKKRINTIAKSDGKARKNDKEYVNRLHGKDRAFTRLRAGLMKTGPHSHKNYNFKEENLEELSKETLKSYADKSHSEFNYSAGKRDGDRWYDEGGKKLTDVDGQKKFKDRPKAAKKADDKIIKKRLTGLSMAYKKLSVKEENLEELSKETLGSYRSKAAKSIGKALAKGDNKTLDKRVSGTVKAGLKIKSNEARPRPQRTAMVNHAFEETQINEVGDTPAGKEALKKIVSRRSYKAIRAFRAKGSKRPGRTEKDYVDKLQKNLKLMDRANKSLKKEETAEDMQRYLKWGKSKASKLVSNLKRKEKKKTVKEDSPDKKPNKVTINPENKGLFGTY